MRNVFKPTHTFTLSSNVANSTRVDAVSSFDAIAKAMRLLEQRNTRGETLRVSNADAEFVALVFWNGTLADCSLIDGATDSVDVRSSHGRTFNPQCPPNYRSSLISGDTGSVTPLRFGKRNGSPDAWRG